MTEIQRCGHVNVRKDPIRYYFKGFSYLLVSTLAYGSIP